jgi:transcriptional regulator with XRE-family HTH domain
MVVALLMNAEPPIRFYSDAIYGQGLRRIRLQRSLLQQGFADLIGVSRRTYQAWETGEHPPRITGYRKLDAVLTAEEQAWLRDWLAQHLEE